MNSRGMDILHLKHLSCVKPTTLVILFLTIGGVLVQVSFTTSKTELMSNIKNSVYELTENLSNEL